MVCALQDKHFMMLQGKWKLEPGPYHNSRFSSLTLSKTPHYLIRVGFRTLLFLKTTNLFLSCCCESTDNGNQLKMIKQYLQPEIIFLTKITTIWHCHIKHFATQIGKLRSEQVNPRKTLYPPRFSKAWWYVLQIKPSVVPLYFKFEWSVR